MTTAGKFAGMVVIVIVVAGGILLAKHSLSGNKSQTNTTNTTSQTASTQYPPSGTVYMTNTLFTPSQITVAKGGTVTWTNNDNVTHTVVADLSDAGGPKSGDIEPGGKYSFTFEKAGSFQYHCSMHSSMRGTIVVK